MLSRIGAILRIVKNDEKALKNIKNVLKKKKSDTDNINVAIIVQLAEIWDKLSPVYTEMKKRQNFNIRLIIVPNYDLKNNCVGNYYGGELEFFRDISDNIILAYKNGKWIDIKDYDFDYVFYQRPYDMYLPEKLKSDYVVKFSKICYIPYAFWPFAKGEHMGYNRDFFKNVYMCFTETPESCVQENRKINFLDFFSRKKKRRKFLYLGNPIFEEYSKIKSNSKVDKYRILWTPRWEVNGELGGCTFLDYVNDFLAFAKENANVDLKFRPHPLMFDNFISKKLMTEKQVDDFKCKLKSCGFAIDNNSMIEDTFVDTDILISDISSIMAAFFLMGKPIIFCDTGREVCKTYKRMMPGIYVAKSWSDVQYYLDRLLAGDDYLFEQRKKIINEEFADLRDVSKKIVDKLEEY